MKRLLFTFQLQKVEDNDLNILANSILQHAMEAFPVQGEKMNRKRPVRDVYEVGCRLYWVTVGLHEVWMEGVMRNCR